MAAEAGAEAVAQAAAVAGAGRERAFVHELAEHDVVGIADGVVAAVNDAIDPACRMARAQALVLDRPLHCERGRVGHDAAGGVDADHRQVGMAVGGHGDRQAVTVVVFMGRFVVGMGRIGRDDQPPVAGEIVRQREDEVARARGTRREGVDRALAERQIGRVDAAVPRQVDRLDDAGRVGVAGVAGDPAQIDALAALQQTCNSEAADRQVGRGDRHALARDVVGLVRFGDDLARVGHCLQAPGAGRQRRHRDRQALRQRAACRQRARGPGRGHYLGRRDAEGIDEPDLLAEEAVHRVVAAVAHRVVDLHRLADAPARRRAQSLDLQVGPGLGLYRRGARGDGDVVGRAAEFIDRRVSIRLDEEETLTECVVRDAELQPGAVAFAHRERADMGDRTDKRRLRREAGAVAEIDPIDPAVHVGGRRALVAHRPADMGTAACIHLGGQVGERGGQIGIGRHDGDRAGDPQVVGAGIGLADAAVRIGHDGDAVAAPDAAGNAHGQASGVAVAWGQAGCVQQDAERHFVGAAEAGIAAQHDAVHPGCGCRRIASVGDGPAQFHRVAGARRGRHDQAGDREVGIGPQGHFEVAAGAVVGLGIAAGIGLEQDAGAGRGAVGHDGDIEAAGAQQAIGQIEWQAAHPRFARGQRQRGRAGEGDQRVQDRRAGTAIGVALAHDDAVPVRHRGRHPPLVQVLPQQRQAVARLQATGLLEMDVAHEQVGADLQRLLRRVVGFQRPVGVVFRDLAERIDDHPQAVAADRVQPGGPVETGLADDAVAGGERLTGQGLTDVGHDGACRQIDPFKPLGPGADGGFRAGVAGGPGDGDRLARRPPARRIDVEAADLQIRIGRQRAAEGQRRPVVLLGAAVLGLGVVAVGFHRDRQLARTGRAIGQAQAEAACRRPIGRQRTRRGLDIGQLGLSQHLAGRGATHDHALVEVAERRSHALVQRAPAHLEGGAGLDRGAARGRRDAQVPNDQVHRGGPGRDLDLARRARAVDVGRQPVGHRRIGRIAGIQQQRVAAGHRGDRLGVGQLMEFELTTVGIDQPQVGPVVVAVAAQRRVVGESAGGEIAEIDEQPVASLGVDRIADDLPGRFDPALDRLRVRQGRGARRIDQAERIGSGVEGVLAQLERVAARSEGQHAHIGRLTVQAQVAALAVGAVGAAQCPVDAGRGGRQVAADGVCAVQPVEDQRARLGQRECVAARLRRCVQRAGDGLPRRDRDRIVAGGELVDLEGHAAGDIAAIAIVRAVENEVDRAGAGGRHGCTVAVRELPIRQRLAVAVEEGPLWRSAAARRQRVEPQQLAGLGIELPDAGPGVRGRRRLDRLPEVQVRHRPAVQPDPSEVVGRAAVTCGDFDRVSAGRQPVGAVPAAADDSAIRIQHAHGNGAIVFMLADAIQVPQARLRDLKAVADLGIGRQIAAARIAGHELRRRDRPAPAGRQRPGAGEVAVGGRAQRAQQPGSGLGQVLLQRHAEGGVPGGGQVAVGVDQLHRAAGRPLARGEMEAVATGDRKAPEREPLGAGRHRQRTVRRRLTVEPVRRRYLPWREAQRAGDGIGSAVDAQDVVTGSEEVAGRVGRLAGTHEHLADRAAIGRAQLQPRLTGIDPHVLQLDPARRRKAEAQVAAVLTGAQARRAVGVPDQRIGAHRRLTQRGHEGLRARCCITLLGDQVERPGLAGGEADRVAGGPRSAGHGAAGGIDQGVGEIRRVAGGAEVEVVGLASHDIEAVHHQPAVGRQLAFDPGGAAVRHGGGLQVQQAERKGGGVGSGLRRDVEAVAAGRQVAHAVAPGLGERQARFDALRAAHIQIGSAGLGVDQDGAVLGQPEVVVVNVAGVDDAAGDEAAERQRGAGLAVAAQRDAGVDRRGVLVAIEIEDVATRLAQGRAPGKLASSPDAAPGAAAGRDVSARVDQLEAELAVPFQRQVEQQVLAGCAVELPGLDFLPQGQAESGRRARRERRQVGVAHGEHPPIARLVVPGAQAQLVAAGGQVQQARDILPVEGGPGQRRTGSVGTDKLGAVAIASGVQPEARRFGQREAQSPLVPDMLHRAAGAGAQLQVGSAARHLPQQEAVGGGQVGSIAAGAQDEAVAAGLGRREDEGLRAIPGVATEAASVHFRAIGVEDVHAVAAVIGGRFGCGENVTAAGLGIEAQGAGGQTLGQRQIEGGAQPDAAGHSVNRQPGAEAVVGAGGVVVVAALHAQRVAACCQTPGRAATRGRCRQWAQRLAGSVEHRVGLGGAGRAQGLDPHLARAGKKEAEVARLVGLQKAASHRVARRHLRRSQRHGRQLETQLPAPERAGVAGDGEQVRAVVRHVERDWRRGGRIAFGQQPAACVVEAEPVVGAGVGATAQAGLDVGTQRDVEEFVGIVGCQVHRHRGVGRERRAVGGVAQAEAGQPAAAGQSERVVAGRQPAHRRLPEAIGFAIERLAQVAAGLGAARAGERPVGPVALLPFEAEPAVAGLGVAIDRFADTEVGVVHLQARRHRHGDGRRCRHRLVARRMQNRRGIGALRQTRQSHQPHEHRAAGRALDDVDAVAAQGAGCRQRSAVGVEGLHGEVVGALRQRERETVARVGIQAPERGLADSQVAERAVAADERLRCGGNRRHRHADLAGGETGRTQLQSVGPRRQVADRRVRALLGIQRRPVELGAR